MGKASKWIINLLLGKKEEKSSIEALPSPSYHNIATSTPTPKVKRRWSFGRSSRRDSTNSKLQLLHTGVDTQINQIKYENEEGLLGQSAWRDAESAAAVKIQSIFRSYLARKALWALRGLVKLQAVARGHLVRKRTASTLHRMHALMAIQLRARLNRLNPTTPNSNNVLQTKYAYSPNLSFSSSSRQQQTRVLHLQDTPASRNSKIYPGRASYSYDRPHHHYLVPTFMAGTQSSKAKAVSSKPKTVRSSSEPKQRPKWITNHKMTSTNETDARTQLSSSHSQHFPPGSLDPWFFELYGSSTRSSRDYNCECDSIKSNYPSLEVLNPSQLWL